MPLFPVRFTNSLGMEFVYIPPGSFMMGSPLDEPERTKEETQHKVTLTRGFYIQTTEVTQDQWQKVMGTDVRRQRDKAGRSWQLRGEGPGFPMYYVSWNDARDFAGKINRMEDTDKYGLPFEAQWEYACRAGTRKPYSSGRSEIVLGEYAWFSTNAGMSARRVAKKKPNAWGLHDMHGNVWEWCEDWYGEYPTDTIADPAGPSSGTFRVLRGGSWSSHSSLCRSAFRDKNVPDEANFNFGFRLVRAL